MFIVLAPFGSRGDVDPVLAVGVRLRQRGHRVLVCAPGNFRDSVAALDLEFASAGIDFRDIFRGTPGNAQLFRASLAQARQQFDALAEVATAADLILGTALQFGAPTLAESLRVPYRYAVFSPMYLRSTAMPAFHPRAPQVPPFVHRMSWALEDFAQLRDAAWLMQKRRDLGLPRVTSLHRYLLGANTVIGAFDPLLSPPPRDGAPVEVTGFWRMASQETLAPPVAEFLKRGTPPIYLGFGSMSSDNSADMIASFARSFIDAGHRVIVGRGWSAVAESLNSADCLVLSDTPHDLLLPRMAIAIHHGGAGTTTAAALSGVPQIIVPHLGDQFYHGTRVKELGLGPEAIPMRGLTVGALVGAVNQVHFNLTYSIRAREFGAGMKAREGSARAAELLEGVASGRRGQSPF